MPLLKGNTPAIISENIREMRQAGHPEDQAVAAAMRTAHGKPHKKKPQPKHETADDNLGQRK